MSEINIGGTLIEFAQLADSENHYAQQLMARYHKGLVHPYCTCLDDKQCREIVIRKRSYYFPARKSNTSGNHAPWCALYLNPALTKYSKDSQPAIIEKGDRLDVKIKTNLTIITDPKPKVSKIYGSEATTNKTKTRASITLLGFLHLCWQKAYLNNWDPNRRSNRGINSVASSINKIANTISVSKQELSNKLVIPHWIFLEDGNQNRDKAYWDKTREKSIAENQQILYDKTSSSGKAAIVIGIVNRLVFSRMDNGNIGVSIQLLDKLLWMPAENAKKAEYSFGQLISEIGKPDRHIIAICTVFRTRDYYAIGEIALMRTNKQFIPVDSSYELQVADKLIDEHRAFTKPLKLGDDPYLPDFVLNDCRGKWVLEVFGVTGDEKYHTRKLEKIQYYLDKQILCWQWLPEADSRIPPLPSK